MLTGARVLSSHPPAITTRPLFRTAILIAVGAISLGIAAITHSVAGS